MNKSVPKQLELFAEPKKPPVTEAMLLQQLADTRREVRNLVVIGLRPDLPVDQRELIRNLERSARVGVRLLLKALACHREHNGHG